MCIRDRADGGQRGGRFIPRRGWSEEHPRHPKTKEQGFRRPSPEGGISPPVVHLEAERPRLLTSGWSTRGYSLVLNTPNTRAPYFFAVKVFFFCAMHMKQCVCLTVGAVVL